MKIVILTSDSPANVWLVNQLIARHEVAGMVIERPPLAATGAEKSDRRRRMIQRYGLLRAFNKLLYNKFRAQFLAVSEAKAVRTHFFSDGSPIAYSRQMPTEMVANINDPACIAFIKTHAPDVLAVCGTTVLKPYVFTLAPKGTVNIHTGITPEYRSADPIFWALYCGEPEKVGVTIHFVDKGIDTGDIIYQETVPVFASDSLAALYVRCIKRGAELYSRALLSIEGGSVVTMSRPSVVGRSFRSIDLGIIQYLWFWLRFRRMGDALPTENRNSSGNAPQ